MFIQLFKGRRNRMNTKLDTEDKSTNVSASASGSHTESADNINGEESNEDTGGLRIRITNQQEYPYLTPSTGWTWKKAPSPDKPLLTKDGRIPKVALAVITIIGAYWNSMWKYDTLFSRLRYLDSLFEGCDVDRLLRHSAYGDVPSDVMKDWSSEIERWKLFNVENGDVYDYIYKQKYDFVLFMNVFPDKAVAGMAYGLPEVIYERYTPVSHTHLRAHET